MGNGNCTNCEGGENNKGLEIIKNDSYESFSEEIKENNCFEKKINKTIPLTKISDNEKNTEKNIQENILSESEKEKNESENFNKFKQNNENTKISNLNKEESIGEDEEWDECDLTVNQERISHYIADIDSPKFQKMKNLEKIFDKRKKYKKKKNRN